eukprot:SAG31_NODE_14790_length_787_cov_1.422965_1_plen_177_part_00
MQPTCAKFQLNLKKWTGPNHDTMFKSLWRTPRIPQHPHWFIHQYIADMVVFGFRQQVAAMCKTNGSSTPPAAPWPALGLHSEAQLKAMPACLSAITSYSAYTLADTTAAAGVPGDQSSWLGLPGVSGPDWKLYADRREKPGWCAAHTCARKHTHKRERLRIKRRLVALGQMGAGWS